MIVPGLVTLTSDQAKPMFPAVESLRGQSIMIRVGANDIFVSPSDNRYQANMKRWAAGADPAAHAGTRRNEWPDSSRRLTHRRSHRPRWGYCKGPDSQVKSTGTAYAQGGTRGFKYMANTEVSIDLDAGELIFGICADNKTSECEVLQAGTR